LLFSMFPAGGLVVAAPGSSLYEADVEVEGQTPQERNRAIERALMKVLIKVSGSRDALRRPEIAGATSQASRLVQQYHYHLIPPPTGGERKADGDGSRYLLKVRFDAGGVNRLLRDNGMPVWGSTRPATLLWLGLESNGSRSLFVPDSDPLTRDAVMRAAGDRGLVLLLPLMDLEDRSAIEFSDVWGGFEERIASASTRYSPDAILAGRLTNAGGGLWRAEWSLYQGGQAKQWESQAPNLPAVAAAGVDRAADVLADRFVPSTSGAGMEWFSIRISNVHDFGAFQRVAAYLDSLSMVEEVRLDRVEPTAGVFRLQVRGGAEALERAVSFGAVLDREAVPVSLPTPTTTRITPTPGTPALQYRLRQ
jgi:hypothetical protein